MNLKLSILFSSLGAVFLLQGGDLIEGCNHNENVHKEVLTDALNLMKNYFKFPIYMVKGNHEAAGIGGEAAYQTILLPEIAKYAGVKKLDSANYMIRQDQDIFIFLDRYSPNWYEFLENSLKSLTEKPRWLFTIIHDPQLPNLNHQGYALRTIQLISQYNGILLCGHRHANTIVRYEKDGKRVVQTTVTTILKPGPAASMRICETESDVRQYKEKCRKKAESNDKKTLQFFDQQWAPYLTDSRHGQVGYPINFGEQSHGHGSWRHLPRGRIRGVSKTVEKMEAAGELCLSLSVFYQRQGSHLCTWS